MGYGTIANRKQFSDALDKTEDGKSLLVIECITTWCPQCKAVAPKIDELNEEFNEAKNVNWFKMNIEEAEDVANEYGVSAVPTFMLFKDGDLLPEEKITGAGEAQKKVRSMIEKNLKA